MRMSRDNLLFAMYSLLTIGVMAYTFQWLDSQHAISSDEALKKAEQSLIAYCTKTGLHPYELQLMDESAPSSKHSPWRFRFQSDRNHRVLVEVMNGGGARVLSRITD